jgi:hypothetical protein
MPINIDLPENIIPNIIKVKMEMILEKKKKKKLSLVSLVLKPKKPLILLKDVLN